MSWQESTNNLNAAQDAYTEAVRIYGADSPEALVADEQAWAASDQHFGTYGNPHDGQPRTC